MLAYLILLGSSSFSLLSSSKVGSSLLQPASQPGLHLDAKNINNKDITLKTLFAMFVYLLIAYVCLLCELPSVALMMLHIACYIFRSSNLGQLL